MKEILQAAVEAIEAQRPAALVTPVATAGSLPTPRNARMLVHEDGSIVGTVGGGRMEAEAQEAAAAVIQAQQPRLIRFSLTAQDVLGDGLLCGGQATFFVEPVLPTTPVETFVEMQELLGARAPGVEAVRLAEEGPVRRLAARADGASAGSLGSAELDQAVLKKVEEVVAEDSADVEEIEAEGEKVRVFVQALQPRPTVYICGGGHVALALARIVPTAGMRAVVIDDRPEFCSRERFPMVDELYVREFPSAFEGLAIDELAYVAVMTRGHRWDREVVTQALRTRARYIGMIGSRRKIALIWEALRKEGFTDADLARVHAPIGLDIGGDTPGEIAISIMAELIQVRYEGGRILKPEGRRD